MNLRLELCFKYSKRNLPGYLQHVTSLYDLMDAASDALEIHAFSQRRLGRVAIIDHNPRQSG